MILQEEIGAIKAHYQSQGTEAIYGKGGFWIKGRGHITIAQARKESGVNLAVKRNTERQEPWGDYAVIAMLNGYKFKH